jgi:hypothetical protein
MNFRFTLRSRTAMQGASNDQSGSHIKLEDTMKNNLTGRTVIATAFVAVSMVSFISIGSAKAGTAGNLHQCDTDGPSYTVQCCESLVRNSEADWIRNSGKGCKALTVCTGGYGNYSCYISYQPPRIKKIWKVKLAKRQLKVKLAVKYTSPLIKARRPILVGQGTGFGGDSDNSRNNNNNDDK